MAAYRQQVSFDIVKINVIMNVVFSIFCLFKHIHLKVVFRTIVILQNTSTRCNSYQNIACRWGQDCDILENQKKLASLMTTSPVPPGCELTKNEKEEWQNMYT